MVTISKISLLFATVYYTYLPLCVGSRGAIELTLRSGNQPFMTFLESIYPAGQSPHPEVGEPIILTTLIQSGRYNVALALASVDRKILKSEVESYAGYLTVDKEHKSNLWFWYFPVRRKRVEKTPLIVCLPGVPGVSSLHGLFTEMGPFNISASPYDYILNENPLSWGKDHSLLFIDSPVGAGFSFTDDEEGYATSNSVVAEHLYSALEQFLLLFPASRAAPLVLAGGGLATNHVLSLASLMHARSSPPHQLMNLQVIMIASGFLDPGSMMAYSKYAFELGLVDANEADAMRASELLTEKALKDGNMELAYRLWTNTINFLLDNSKIGNLFNYINDDPETSNVYINKMEAAKIRTALNVGNTPFTRLGKPYKMLESDLMSSAQKNLEEALEHYRVLCYSGQLDVLMAYPLSVRVYKKLHWSGSELYRHSERRNWYHKKQLAGYYTTAGRFTEVMVRAAGHMMSADQPERVRALISAFIKGIGLEKDTGSKHHSDSEYEY